MKTKQVKMTWAQTFAPMTEDELDAVDERTGVEYREAVAKLQFLTSKNAALFVERARRAKIA